MSWQTDFEDVNPVPKGLWMQVFLRRRSLDRCMAQVHTGLNPAGSPLMCHGLTRCSRELQNKISSSDISLMGSFLHWIRWDSERKTQTQKSCDVCTQKKRKGKKMFSGLLRCFSRMIFYWVSISGGKKPSTSTHVLYSCVVLMYGVHWINTMCLWGRG